MAFCKDEPSEISIEKFWNDGSDIIEWDGKTEKQAGPERLGM
jgi:hypothetical protein